MAINIELRANEIAADMIMWAWSVMSPAERRGWDMHAAEWWEQVSGENAGTPKSRHEWAGWLAREIWTQRFEEKR
jgi:hypothetical protein